MIECHHYLKLPLLEYINDVHLRTRKIGLSKKKKKRTRKIGNNNTYILLFLFIYIYFDNVILTSKVG